MSGQGHGVFADNPQYRAYQALLKRLQDLNGAGLQDAPEADAVRDQMEGVWYELTPPEQERLSGLCADLYSFSDEEPLGTPSPAEAAELRRGLAWCYQRCDWQRVLQLLRKGHHLFPKAALAYARAHAWRELGDAQVASWFLEQARALDPGHDQDEDSLETVFRADEPRRPSAG